MDTNIDSVDWNALGESKIRGLLHDILSDDEEARIAAHGALQDEIAPWEVLEGHAKLDDLANLIKREALVKIIPILIEMLDEVTVKNKDAILELIFQLTVFIDLEQDRVREQDRKWYRERVCAILHAVKQGKNTYQRLADEHDDTVSTIASELLKRLRLCDKYC